MNTIKSTVRIFQFFLLSLLVVACGNGGNDFDASGTFESEEIIVSAEANGVLKELTIEEGDELQKGDLVGYIDTVQLHLMKKQMEAQYEAVLSRQPDVAVQLAALQSQLKTAESERERMRKLVEGDAATPKQLDDMDANIDVIKSQIEAQRSSLVITKDGLTKEAGPLLVQIEQLEDQLAKSRVVNPIQGTVLAKYARENEMVSSGKPIYKIADLRTMILRAYISGDQLAKAKLNEKVSVMTDDGSGGMKEAEGVITWINDKAEFTPKTVQTKDERANAVYAVKVEVPNDGAYKIGMYGELKFRAND